MVGWFMKIFNYFGLIGMIVYVEIGVCDGKWIYVDVFVVFVVLLVLLVGVDWV